MCNDATIIIENNEVLATIVIENNCEQITIISSGLGTPGLSAYDIAVANGFIGTEAQWIASIQVTKTSDLINDGADGIHPFITSGGGGGSQTLAQTLDLGNNTGGNDILLNNADSLLLENTSSLKKGTYDFGGAGGLSRICSNNYEDMWQNGFRHVFDQSGFIRNSTNCFNVIPDNTFDETLRFKFGSIWTLDDGTNYICTDATEGAAVWQLYNVIPTQTSDLINNSDFVVDGDYVHTENNYTDTEKTKLALIEDGATNVTKTSDLINDGDNGISHFISLEDLPSNIVFYPTNVASDIGGYVKIVTSITDPSYNTTAVDISTGAITTTDQLISSLATSANIIVGNPGVLNITTIGNIRRISGSGEASFFFRVYKRTLAGVETLVATSDNTIPVIDGGTYVEFSATAIWNDGIFLDTDRVVMKYYANRITGGSNPTYEFQFGGVTPVRTLVPIPLSVVPSIGLDGLNDVVIASVADKQLLSYDTATSLWKNKSVTTVDIADSTNKRYQTENQNTFNDATSSIQTQLDSKTRAFKSAIDGTTVTNTTTITATYSQLIPANTFVAGDVVKNEFRITSPNAKTNSTNAYIYVNSTNSLSGATQIGLFNTTATGRTVQLERTLSVKGATTKVTAAAGANSTDTTQTASMTTLNINWTIDQYIIFAIGHTLASATETSFGDFYKITKN